MDNQIRLIALLPTLETPRAHYRFGSRNGSNDNEPLSVHINKQKKSTDFVSLTKWQSADYQTICNWTFHFNPFRIE